MKSIKLIILFLMAVLPNYAYGISCNSKTTKKRKRKNIK